MYKGEMYYKINNSLIKKFNKKRKIDLKELKISFSKTKIIFGYDRNSEKINLFISNSIKTILDLLIEINDYDVGEYEFNSIAINKSGVVHVDIIMNIKDIFITTTSLIKSMSKT